MLKKLLEKKFSIEDIGLYGKNALALLFMLIIPLLLVCNLVFFTPDIASDKDRFLEYARLTIIMMTASGLFGFLFMRRTIKSLINIIRKAERLASGKKGGEIKVASNDELKVLASSFNAINTSLEVKVRELEYSQRLTRELFQQIGHAITGSQKMKALFDIIVHGVRKVLGTSSAFIALYDRSGALRLKAYSGMDKSMHEDMVLPDTKSITGLGRVPISIDGNIKGILCIADKAGGQKIGPEDTALLENIAGQIALCVENMELNRSIEDAYYDTLVMLARVVEAKDPYSAGHLERVSSYVKMMADKLNLDDDSKKILSGGALLHDLGKVGVDDAILKKAGNLTLQEYEVMKQHAVIGENILKPLHAMSKLSVLVRHHHELYDGSGYPDGLKGEEIPLLARILTVADMYDAITTDRPYRKGLGRDEAIEEIKKYAGNKLDPKLVEVFVDLIKSRH